MSTKQQKKVAKPNVSIIGAGRLGTALALALSHAGYRVLSLVARRLSKAKAAASLIKGRPLALGSSQLARLPASDILLISTPDDVLESVAGELSRTYSFTRAGVALHTSGALSSALLAPLAEAGFHTGSLHPLVSISQAKLGAQNLRGAFFCIEGDRTASRVARTLVRDLNGQSFSIGADKKALYHAAAVMTAGHVVALFDVASEMLVQSGLDSKTARRVLLPLLKSAVGNLDGTSPERALTGTFSRGDHATVVEHLRALHQTNLTTALAVYRLLGSRSLELAQQRGMSAELVEALKLTLLPLEK